MEDYIVKEGKRLRLGCTTGTCAAAAAKAAALGLLSGRCPERVGVLLPGGRRLELAVAETERGPDWLRCGVRKDAGDDPDVTDGALICALVRRTETPGVLIDGGAGVGRVTQPGLDQPVGAAAINSVPRRMIRESVQEVLDRTDEPGGLSVTISVPGGEELAKKTFNPRLGILGGSSILGTTGIVEPMSEQALVETIRAELRQRRAQGVEWVLLTPGNYGADFIRDGLGLDPERAVQTSNFIGETLEECKALGFAGALLVGHIGKLVKLAGGMWNTHSKYGDCRMDILTACAAAEGLDPDRCGRMLGSVMTDEAVRILEEAGLRRQTLDRLAARIEGQLRWKCGEALETGAILFSKVSGRLCETAKAEALLERIRTER